MDHQEEYREQLTSRRTQSLFIVLTILSYSLFVWRFRDSGWETVTTFAFCFTLFFLFYTFNYRTLNILITPQDLSLNFGIFTWTIPLDNIDKIYVDETSLWRISGAGIHFSSLSGRYRAMFNFLEYPRLVVMLKKPRGPVKDIAFSTRYPDNVQEYIMAMKNIPHR